MATPTSPVVPTIEEEVNESGTKRKWEDLLSCPCCLTGGFHACVLCPSTGHIVCCEKCAGRTFSQKYNPKSTCPVCRIKIDCPVVTPLLYFNRIWATEYEPCEGCALPMIPDHDNHCKNPLEGCPLGCPWRGRHQVLATHVQKDCCLRPCNLGCRALGDHDCVVAPLHLEIVALMEKVIGLCFCCHNVC